MPEQSRGDSAAWVWRIPDNGSAAMRTEYQNSIGNRMPGIRKHGNPKSIHKERVEQNYAIEDFGLDESDMEKIRQMDRGSIRILEIQSLSEVKRLYDIQDKYLP